MNTYTYDTEDDDFNDVLDQLGIDSDQNEIQRAWVMYNDMDKDVEATVYHFENNRPSIASYDFD